MKIESIISFSAYLLILLMPAYLIRFPLAFGGSLNGLDLVQLFFIAISNGYIFQKRLYSQFSSFLQEKKSLLLTIILLTLGASLSFLLNLTAENWQTGLGILKSFFCLPILSALLISFFISLKILQLEKIYFSYFTYSSLISLGAIYFLLQNQRTYDGRLAFIFNSPNFLAMTLVPGILLGLAYLFKKCPLSPKTHSITAKMPKHQLVIGVLLALHIITLLYTRSLGAFIGLIFAGLIILYAKHKKTLIYFTVSISLLFFCTLLILPALLNLSHYQPSVPATSFDSRLAIYQSAGKIAQNHWLWGIGPGNFQETYLDYQAFFPPYPQWAVPHAHNLILHFWVELGLLGLIGLISMLWLWVKKATSLPDTSPARLAIIILIYLLIHGLFDMTIWKNDLAFLFWLLFFI